MSLVFDTSIILELERGNKEIINKIKKYLNYYPDPAQISFMTYFEIYYGLRNKNEKNKDLAIGYLNMFKILEVTKKTAEIMSSLKHSQEKKGIQMSLTDLFIASQVIENNLILVTMDKDFERIDNMEKIIL